MYLEEFPYNIDIKDKKFPDVIPAFIEVSQNSRVKYEWDHNKQSLVLDRVLHSAVFYPHNYGFIPQTLCDDGDPLDVLVMCSEALLPGSIAYIRPICYMIMEDEKGMDEKLLAVANNDPHYDHLLSINDIPKHTLDEISQFFETYKTLEKEKWVKVGSWLDKELAFDLIKRTNEYYKKIKKDSCEDLTKLAHL